MQINKELKLLLGDNNGKFPFCNALWIDDDIKALIDTGCGNRARKDAGALEPEVVIFSHYHLDHIRDSASFTSPIYCHAADIPPVEREDILLEYTGFAEMGAEVAQGLLRHQKYQSVPVTGSFADGDVLDFGRTKLQVIHTPGHSPGHCCFFVEKEGLLFSADIDLTPFGPWYGHNSCELDAFESSIKRVMELNPAVVISSHTSLIQKDIPASFLSYLDVIRQRDLKIQAFLTRPATVEEIAAEKIIFGRHPAPYVKIFFHFEKKMVQKHLDRLFTRGEIRVEGNRYVGLEKRFKFFPCKTN